SASAARTSSSTPSAPTAARDTTPAATPSPVSRSAMTVSLLDLVTPLVVSVLPAHRRFAVLDSSAITMQSSARDSSSARSTASCGLMSVPSVRLRRACSRGLPSSRARSFVAARAPQSSPRGAPPARTVPSVRLRRACSRGLPSSRARSFVAARAPRSSPRGAPPARTVPSVRLRRACSRGLPSSRARSFVAARAPRSSPRGAPPARTVPSVRLRRACSRGLPSSRARSFVAARAPRSSPRGAPPARSLARLLQGVEDVDAAEQRRRAAVADRRDLPRLALAAVERAAQHVRLRAADGLHGVPEVGGGRLVGDVAELPGQPPVLDPVEPLPGELEVVALHV